MSVRQPTPIAVFAYNRPLHLQITLEALGRCEGFEGDQVRIFCDAPRTPAQAAGVAEVRRLARDWTAAHGGTVCERAENFGFRNITAGVTDLCRAHGRVIVVEDDIVVAPDFLNYLHAALDRYADEPRVFLASAFMYADAQPPEPPLFFLPTALIWGWATWQRAWQHYDWNAPGWQELLADPRRRRRFDVGGCYP
jgi:hypothetical protein